MKPAEDDFMNVRAAAKHVGYDVQPALTCRKDPAVRAFYAWANSHSVKKHYRGRSLLFTRADLDRAIGRSTEKHAAEHLDRLEQMAELGRQHANGEYAH